MKRHSGIVWVGVGICCVGLAGCAADKTHSAAAPGAHPAVTPLAHTEEWMLERHGSFNKRARQGDVDLIFVGDSITHGWEQEGKDVWDQYYGRRKAMNLGIAGDTTQHVLWRLNHGNLDGISPKAAVLMIGTNNSNGAEYTTEQIADGIIAITNLLRSKLPRTKVLILAVFPRGAAPSPQREKNVKASEMAAKLADGKMIHYMDIGPHFLEADGTLTTDIMPDYLHLSPRGYKVWAIAIESKLRELLGE